GGATAFGLRRQSSAARLACAVARLIARKIVKSSTSNAIRVTPAVSPIRIGYDFSESISGHAVMAPRKRRPFTGLLCKPIDLADAKPLGPRVSLAEPPNESDVKTHIMEEIEARYIALDTFFSLDSNSLNIWEERAKALLTYRSEIPAYALQSWEHLARYLTHRYAPGFSLKRPSKNRFGAPLEWDYDKLAKLFADVEFLRRNTSMGLREIFEKLPTQTREYTKRWGRHRGKPGGLRKAYAKAKKLLDQDFKFQLHLCGGEVASRERP